MEMINIIAEDSTVKLSFENKPPINKRKENKIYAVDI